MSAQTKTGTVLDRIWMRGEPLGYGFIQRGCSDIDGVRDAVYVFNGDSAGADRHEGHNSMFAFCSPCL